MEKERCEYFPDALYLVVCTCSVHRLQDSTSVELLFSASLFICSARLCLVFTTIIYKLSILSEVCYILLFTKQVGLLKSAIIMHASSVLGHFYEKRKRFKQFEKVFGFLPVCL